MGYTYDDEVSSAERWLILNDKEQTFPTENLEVASLVERKTQAGKSMPVMTLTGVESGETFLICAWKRDVNACIKEYGVNPDQWDDVGFERKNGRWTLVPRAKKILVENV